jgi:hypothetical protein
MRLTTVDNNKKYRKVLETGFFSWLKSSLCLAANTDHKNIRMTTAIRTSWSHTHKLVMVKIGLMSVMTMVVCSAILGYARLQLSNAEKSAIINSYSQSSVTLSKQYKDINNLLAANNLVLAANGQTQTAALAQLTGYAGNGNPTEFASYADLTAWLQTDDTHEQIYSPTFQCVDFAFMMSEHAIKAGYWIFPAVDLADGHMQCIAPIGKDLYAIEPQTNAVSLWAVKSDP